MEELYESMSDRMAPVVALLLCPPALWMQFIHEQYPDARQCVKDVDYVHVFKRSCEAMLAAAQNDANQFPAEDVIRARNTLALLDFSDDEFNLLTIHSMFAYAAQSGVNVERMSQHEVNNWLLTTLDGILRESRRDALAEISPFLQQTGSQT